MCPPEGIPLGAFRRRCVAWAHEKFPALVARTCANQCRQKEPLQGRKPGAVTGLAELGGEHWAPYGAGCTCPMYPKSEPLCQTTTGALNVLGDLPLTPAFGPWHTEASRNPVVLGTAPMALCGEADTLDPRGFCICAFACSPSVLSESLMDRCAFQLRSDKVTPCCLVSTLMLYTSVLFTVYLMPVFPSLSCFLLATSLCKMAPSTGLKFRKVAMCPTEILCVLGELQSGMRSSAAGHEFHRNKSTTCIFKRCL